MSVEMEGGKARSVNWGQGRGRISHYRGIDWRREKSLENPSDRNVADTPDLDLAHDT